MTTEHKLALDRFYAKEIKMIDTKINHLRLVQDYKNILNLEKKREMYVGFLLQEALLD